MKTSYSKLGLILVILYIVFTLLVISYGRLICDPVEGEGAWCFFYYLITSWPWWEINWLENLMNYVNPYFLLLLFYIVNATILYFLGRGTELLF